jgi:hypothetical protein
MSVERFFDELAKNEFWRELKMVVLEKMMQEILDEARKERENAKKK